MEERNSDYLFASFASTLREGGGSYNDEEEIELYAIRRKQQGRVAASTQLQMPGGIVQEDIFISLKFAAPLQQASRNLELRGGGGRIRRIVEEGHGSRRKGVDGKGGR